MRDAVTVFHNEEFGEIRTADVDGKIFFCGNDVAKALGYAKPNNAIQRYCRATLKRGSPISGKMQEINFIPESDVYRLIVSSKLPTAERFEKWVFEDVLPSIRKHGGYLTAEMRDQVLSDPDTLIRLATELKAERAEKLRLQSENEQNAPKVLFAEAVSKSQTDILVGEMAKILCQNGMDVGQNRFFKILRRDGYLMKERGTQKNIPTQRSIQAGLMRVKETAIQHADGRTTVNITPLVTAKGQMHFIHRYIQTAGG